MTETGRAVEAFVLPVKVPNSFIFHIISFSEVYFLTNLQVAKLQYPALVAHNNMISNRNELISAILEVDINLLLTVPNTLSLPPRLPTA